MNNEKYMVTKGDLHINMACVIFFGDLFIGYENC